MSGTIFDLVEIEPRPGQEGFFDLAAQAPMPEEKSFFGKAKKFAKEYGKTALKGSAEGLYQLGRIAGPVGLPQHKEFTEELNRLLPTEKEQFGQKALRRGLKELPTALSFPGASLGTIPRALGAGVAGQTAEELGAPEWLQTASEITAYLSPDVTKNCCLQEKTRN